MSAALPALLQLLLRLVLRRERLGVAIRGLRSSGQPYWASVSTHSWQLAWRAYAIALLPWASLAIKSTPYCRKNQRGIVINHLLPLKPRITGIPALFFSYPDKELRDDHVALVAGQVQRAASISFSAGLVDLLSGPVSKQEHDCT